MSFDIIEQQDGLRTVANIPIATVGEEWETMTGPLTVTQEDLESAVNALSDPSIKLPRVKLGHLDPRFTPDGDNGIFDGTPVLGKFDNLRLSADHQTLYADAIGVPEWFATIMPYAYPNRSMEGFWGVKTQTGHDHKFVITAVSLLGDEYPAIETLEDLQTMFSAEGPDWANELIADTKRVAASKGGSMPRERQIAASTSVEDVRRAFFEDFATEDSGRYWWWIRAVYMDPNLLICADEQDDLWAVPYTVEDNGANFGDPVNVFTQYVETDSGKVAASKVMGDNPAIATFSKSGGSRPENKTKGDEVGRIQASIDVGALRSRLGLTEEQLPDDASEEQINEAITAPAGNVAPEAGDTSSPEQPEPGTPAAGTPQPGQPSEGGTATGNTGPDVTNEPGAQASASHIDAEALRQLQEDARLGREARQEQVQARRDEIVRAAVKDRKIPPSRFKHYRSLMDGDEAGTTEFLGSLEKGVVPGDTEIGAGQTPESESLSGSEYPQEWLSDSERSRIAAAREGKSTQRVVTEAV